VPLHSGDHLGGLLGRDGSGSLAVDRAPGPPTGGPEGFILDEIAEPALTAAFAGQSAHVSITTVGLIDPNVLDVKILMTRRGSLAHAGVRGLGGFGEVHSRV
jgi:hypothetical protein